MIDIRIIDTKNIDTGWMFPWLYDFQSHAVHWILYSRIDPVENRRTLRMEIRKEL